MDARDGLSILASAASGPSTLSMIRFIAASNLVQHGHHLTVFALHLITLTAVLLKSVDCTGALYQAMYLHCHSFVRSESSCSCAVLATPVYIPLNQV